MKKEVFEYKDREYIIQIGKNSQENFDIIDDSIETDVWFHVEGEASCHVILKNTEKMKDIPKQVIKRCAYLCKINSKAKTQNNCSIIYTSIKNVTKTEVIGQVNVSSYKTVKM